MRYLVHESQISEIPARQSYLYDIFRLYFLPGKPEGSFIPLLPVGEKGSNALFITGHNDQVSRYLTEFINDIPEKRIVITSCLGLSFSSLPRQKEVFVPRNAPFFCFLRNGRSFGFSFLISDAELNFYNSHGDFEAKLNTAYMKI